ncbi:MAG: hypothetical protein FVQ80_02365 [Planctomycetes bacterium]|nr:hypothetical protein [Planctomycetota bacterium]
MARFVDNAHGQAIRSHFKDNRGSSELAMLATPSSEEFEQLKKAVAIMTKAEKESAAELDDEQVEKIADDAKIDNAIFVIFMNGFTLRCKRVS